MTRDLLVSLRPHQWVKNAFVISAPLFARQLLEPEAALRSIAAFLVFSAASSAVYLLNDVCDREQDRLHERKRDRPIAAGRVGVRPAMSVSLLLGVASLGFAWLLAPAFSGLIAAYFVIQVAYSLRLRRVVLADVLCISAGFVLRILAGAAVIDVRVSSWLILTTIFLSLFLALAKRRAEQRNSPGEEAERRETLSEYPAGFLDSMLVVTTACLLMCYSLYTLADRTVSEFGTRHLVYTVPFVIFGVFRYLLLVHQGRGGESPSVSLFADRPLAASVVLWLLLTASILYL